MSTRSALTIVGGVVGAYFGYPQLGLAIGALVGGAVDPQTIQGPKIGEVSGQTSAEGAPRTIVYGTTAVYGNVIQTGPLIKTTDTETQGKGGPVAENEVAYRTYAIRICEGPISAVLRVWADNKLVYDVRPGSAMLAESAAWAQWVFFHLGDEAQLPDVFLTANVNPDSPAYRGTAYATFLLQDLTDRRGSIPQYRFEVAQSASSSVVTLPTVVTRGLRSVAGGGTFDDFFVDDHAMNAPGSCWCAVWTFTRVDSPSTFTLQVKVAGSVVWSRAVSFPVIGPLSSPVIYKVQINHPSDSATITAGWSGSFSGEMRVAVYGLTEDYEAYVGSGSESDIYESDNDYFGVLVNDDGDLGSAGAVGSSPAIAWGPETIATESAGDPVPLGDIIADIHDRCGIDSANFDVSELTDLVSGLALAGDYTGADAINSVRPLYFFDKSEHDTKLWYPKRGADVMDSWSIDDLTEVPDSTQREQALEIPKKLHLFYQHAISGYARVKATAASSSPDLMTTGEVTIEVPVVLNEDQAAQAADKAYKVTRAEINGTTEISIPLDIGIVRVPSNPVGLTLRGTTRRLRIDSMAYADGVFKLSLKNDRQSAYTSDLTGVPIPPPTLPPSTIVGETVFAVLDIAARVDSEDDLNYLVAVTGASPAWHGARYQRSLDTGANWTTVRDITTASIVGYLQEDVPSASADYTDTTNSVTVHLIREGQTLDSLTEAEFLSEGGAFALEKADGSFEIMQYLDASEDSAGDFTLTTLHRGLLNSGASAHVAGARFVMLAKPSHIDAQSSWIGQDLTHRAISLGDTADNTDNEETATFVGRSQIEWPVASFALTRSGNNVTGTWVPRHRFGSDDAPVASVNFRGYRVTIVGTSTVTFDQTAQTFTYDVSAIGGSVTVSVSALNRITGSGPATSGTI